MCGGKARAQRRCVTTVEEEQGVRRAVAQPAADGRAQLFDRRAAKTAALKVEIGEFLQRVDATQVSIELQAVDHPNAVAEPDVLRAQVAVTLHDAARARTRGEQLPVLLQEPTLSPLDAAHRHRRQRKARV